MVEQPETRRIDDLTWASMTNIAPLECWVAEIRSFNREERKYVFGELRWAWAGEESLRFFHSGFTEGSLIIPPESQDRRVRSSNILMRVEFDKAIEIKHEIERLSDGVSSLLVPPRELHEEFPYPELEG